MTPADKPPSTVCDRRSVLAAVSKHHAAGAGVPVMLRLRVCQLLESIPDGRILRDADCAKTRGKMVIVDDRLTIRDAVARKTDTLSAAKLPSSTTAADRAAPAAQR